jgi:hypothetical protein
MTFLFVNNGSYIKFQVIISSQESTSDDYSVISDKENDSEVPRSQ